MSKQEDFHRPEKPLGKTWEIDNIKESRNEKKIQYNSEVDNSVQNPAKLSNILDIIDDLKSSFFLLFWLKKETDRQIDRQTDRQTDR